jgi:predicted metalloprotease with PDZ domain
MFSDFGLDYHEQAEVFEIGFDWDQNLLVTHVHNGSNAEKAGIQAGDLLVDYSFEYERPDFEGSVRLRRNGKEIDLQFYPSKTRNFPVLKETAKNSGLLGF